MILMTGKELAAEIKQALAGEVKARDLKLKLVVIQVGDNEASSKYIAMKGKACESVGIAFEHIHFKDTVTEIEIYNKITDINKDKGVTGVIVQLPLPGSLDTDKIVDFIDPTKDVDGLTTENMGRLTRGLEGLFPATAEGVINLLRYYDIPLSGANAVVIGRSNLVGKPLALMLLTESATVTICHSKTKDISKYTKQADVVIAAVGKQNLLTADMISHGAVVVDVGQDVDFDIISTVAGFLTPPTGGVGPMTVAMLLSNVVKAAKMQKGE